jgi:hypothetical protein
MVRTLVLTALLSAGFALPAMAGDTASFNPANSAELSTALDNAATGEQVRLQLMHNGFTHVSAIKRQEPNRWVGTAEKNGKKLVVAVLLPHIASPTPATD